MFRLFIMQIKAPETGAESEERNEGYQSTKHERRGGEDIYSSEHGIRTVEKEL